MKKYITPRVGSFLMAFWGFILFPLFSLSQHIINVGVDNGLSSRQTFNIVQDTDRFIWIATRFGIDRYDGINIKHYAIDIMHNGSYPIRMIKLFQDKEQNVWAYTDRGIIYQYDTQKDLFVEQADFKKFIKSAGFDNHDQMWAVTNSELAYLDNGEWFFIEQRRLVNELYKNVTGFDENHILLQTNRNTYKYNVNNEELFPIIDSSIIAKYNLRIEAALYEEQSERLWIGTVDKGLYLYDVGEKHLLQIQVPELLFHPIISLCNFDSTYLLIGTDGVGMFLLNKETLKVEEQYSQNSGSQHQIDGGAIYNIFKDDSNRIWVSTYSAGVYIFDYLLHGFKSIKHEKENTNKLRHAVVCDILEDSDGKIWIGTNNDLSIWDREQDRWKYLLDSKNVMKLFEDSKQNIWAGTYSSGVYKYNKNGALICNYTNRVHDANSLGTNFVYAIYEDNDGNIWFGGKRGMLSKLNTQSNTFTQININQINQIIGLGKDSLLIATEIGLMELEIDSGNFKSMSLNKNLRSSYISDLYLESDSILWLATYGDGLNRCNLITNEVRSYGIKDGLPSNILYAIIVDDDNRLWFSSENGIGSFDLQTHQTLNFSAIDGVVGNQFRQLSKEKGKDGKIYFGSYDGLTYFNPNEIKKYGRDARLFLDEFRLFNKTILPGDKGSPLKKSLDKTEKIQLNYQQHSFSFNFTAIDYSIDKNRRYMWRLENLDNNWVGPTTEHVANYTNIKEGDYRLVVRYLDENNNILDERVVLISITPPFWNTSWARIIFIFITLLVAYGIYYYAKQRLKRKHTKEKMEFFINTAHDIRTPLTLINGPFYELKEQVSASPRTEHLLNLITSNLGKLNGIISQLLDFQKVYSLKNELVVKKWNLNKYLIEKLNYWKSCVQSKTIVFELELPSEEIEEWFDLEKMDKILDNLVLNAIKYTPDQGQILIKLIVDDKTWKIDIIDSGIGISKQDQKNLFTKFYRARNAINSQETGSGLGLLLVQKYVELHKGRISMKSDENKGSTFSVQFKRGDKIYLNDTVLDDYNIPIVDENVVSPPSLYNVDNSRVKILVVEDNDDLRQYMKMSLSAYYSVYVAENGKVAWDNLLKINPDIIVTDLQMPEMDGFELCQKIKTTFETSHIPVILLTVVSDTTHMTKGFNLGADDYIEKPFNIKYLSLKINNIIQNRQIMRQKFLGMDKQEVEEVKNETINDFNIQFIEEVTAIIENNLSNTKFSIKDLSKEMKLSRTLLFSKFNAITGYTPNDYIKITRMKKAISYFKENKYTINEVALMVGFEEHSYFSTSFKRMYGKTPKQFIEEDLFDKEV